MAAPTTGRRLYGAAAAVALLAGGAASGCSPAEQRGPVAIDHATVDGTSSIQVVVGSCHGDPVVTALVEDVDRVEIEVTSTTFREGDSCQDTLVVELHEPLGTREIVDATSGETVRVEIAAR